MFAASQDKAGIWRLSIRRIRLITGYYRLEDGVRMDVRFTSRAKAKECADLLNMYYSYDKYFDNHTGTIIKGESENAAFEVKKNILRFINDQADVTVDVTPKAE